MQEFEKTLGYTFKNKDLLTHALTHSSYANENRGKGVKSNERLEFLGDSILGFTVAEYLYRKFKDQPEGELTRMRAGLVCEQSLAGVAEELKIGEHLRLGRGEDAGGGRERPSILADAAEAVFAAVYLDGGDEAAKDLVKKVILERAENMDAVTKNNDYKTLLQELVQQEKEQILSYELIGSEGPDHDKLFAMRVLLNGRQIGEGRGKSKKEAEQEAARAAFGELSK